LTTYQQHSSLTETREANEFFNTYKNKLIRGVHVETKDGKKKANLSIEESKESIQERISGLFEGINDENRIQTAIDIFDSAKNDLKKSFDSNNFISSRLAKYNWKPSGDSKSIEEQLTDQIYSLYAYSSFLLVSQVLVSRMLSQEDLLEERVQKDDIFANMKIMYMFAHNNDLLNQIGLDDFNAFYKYIESLSYKIPPGKVQWNIVDIFKEQNKEKSATLLNKYIDYILNDSYSKVKGHISDLNVLWQLKNRNIMTVEDVKSDDNFSSIELIFNEFFESKNITDPDVKRLFIGNVLMNIGKLDKNSTPEQLKIVLERMMNPSSIKTELDAVYKKIGSYLQTTQSQVQTLTNIYEQNEFEKIKDLEKQSNIKLQEAFLFMMEKITEDGDVDEKEKEKLKKLKSIFTEERYKKLIDKILKGLKTKDEPTSPSSMIIQFLNEVEGKPENDGSDKESGVNPDGTTKTP
jgi:hypothetical protein